MIKRAQNRVAGSRLTLPVVMAYAIAVWLASGLLIPAVPITLASLLQGAWVQFVCFLLSAYLMAELNNNNALIRIFSRLVSCSFLVLLCAACFLFVSMRGAIVQLCIIAFYLLFFRTYQDKESAAWPFYAFLCLGLASTAYVHILFYIPFFFIMMHFQLSSLSWRTFFASVIGLITPYWFLIPWFVFKYEDGQFVKHLMALADFQPIHYFQQIALPQLLILVFVLLLAVTGTVHYLRNSHDDRIRVRQLYGFFIFMWLLTAVFLFLQPQHYDILLRILIINTSPLIAHFISLTHTRITNIAFYVISTVAVLLMLFNLWMPSLTF